MKLLPPPLAIWSDEEPIAASGRRKIWARMTRQAEQKRTLNFGPATRVAVG